MLAWSGAEAAYHVAVKRVVAEDDGRQGAVWPRRVSARYGVQQTKTVNLGTFDAGWMRALLIRGCVAPRTQVGTRSSVAGGRARPKRLPAPAGQLPWHVPLNFGSNSPCWSTRLSRDIAFVFSSHCIGSDQLLFHALITQPPTRPLA